MQQLESREQIISVLTEDEVRHEGIVFRPPTNSGVEAKPTTIVFIHGHTGHFYSPFLLTIGRELALNGYTFVSGNNRGHDFGVALWRGNQRLLAGGGWELFAESPLDVAAWVEYAAGLSPDGKTILIGHSLGGVKVTYYQGTRNDPRVKGLVIASAPMRSMPQSPDHLELARQMLAEGRGRDLMPWGSFPVGGGAVSAQTYLGRWQSEIDVFGFSGEESALSKIKCPTLAFFGTDEMWVGTPEHLEQARSIAKSSKSFETKIIPGADHVYTGHEGDLVALLLDWAGRLG